MSLEQNLIDNLSSDPTLELSIVRICAQNENGIGYFPRLQPHHFSVERYQGYWEAIRALAGRGEAITPVQIRRWLKNNSLQADMVELIDGTYHETKLLQMKHAVAEETMIEFWQKRETKKLGGRMQVGSVESTEAQTLLTEILNDTKEVRAETVEQITARVMEEFEEAYNAVQSGNELPNAVKMGIPEVDKMGGHRTGDLVIIAGRPAMGKSTVSRLSMLEVAKNFPVLALTHEMTKEQIVSLFGSTLSGLNSQAIRKADISAAQYSKYQNGLVQAAALNITVDYITELNSMIAGIRSWRMATDMSKPAAVYIDYLQQVPVNIRGKSRNEQVGLVSRMLKEIAKTLNLTVFALAQLNRGVETRGGDKRPILSDLRDSGEIEQDADMVVFLYRPEYYGFNETHNGDRTENMVEAIVQKNRHGQTGTGIFFLDLTTGKRLHNGYNDVPF